MGFEPTTSCLGSNRRLGPLLQPRDDEVAKLVHSIGGEGSKTSFRAVSFKNIHSLPPLFW